MRKVIYLMHVSLDGFVAGLNGEMDWIKVDDEMFDDVASYTSEADTAIYGRKTFGMMESYWPTAGQEPDASKHDKEHSEWANKSLKLVFSTTLKKSNWENTKIVKGNPVEEIAELKGQAGKNLLMIGSPTLSYDFVRHDLIDEYHININPVILGEGLPLFSAPPRRKLTLMRSTQYKSGVIGVQYKVQRD